MIYEIKYLKAKKTIFDLFNGDLVSTKKFTSFCELKLTNLQWRSYKTH